MAKRVQFILIIVAFLFGTGRAAAQDVPQLSLSLIRNFGSSLGGAIQGTFTYRVNGPDNLVRVTFLMDGETIGEDNKAPFRLQFHTDTYALGIHTMSAIGYTSDGAALESNSLQRRFVSGRDAGRITIWILIPILVLAIGGRLISGWIANRGRTKDQPAISGLYGGTICPKCQQPFALHIWGLNVVVGKYDRCPHCGKWSLVQRAHPDVLHEAAGQVSEADNELIDPLSAYEDKDFRQQLDDSRFE